ncbi:MAG: DNA gyrase subunit A [Lachnospiraceae bacterium]|nr:DNA gyrase subunit A [Lachnospiraceae bacterium]
MDDHIFDQIHEVDLKKTMETSYIEYAMSVIAARALPDVRDGLKPVQRRILYSMTELHNDPDKPHRKCARIVGDTMGKYHPHGDSSIYEALVKLAQDFTTRYPLVDGHGNFGSVDGDGAAAMRYTEARLSWISTEMLSDITKDTVDFIPNFDETEKEPTVLPSRYPNLLVNGTSGIAVGMATNIPPHNLREVIAAVRRIIENRIEEDRETTIEEIMEIVKGPDFPTGANIIGHRAIEEAYRTGRGKIRVRAVTDIEAMPNGKNRIIVTEIPFMVNKARLIEKIAELVKDKKIDGITDLRDESDREGMRIVIELRRDVNANVVLNQLMKHTQLQDTFGVIMLALVNNEPKVLNLLEMLKYYITHQEDVVRRRTIYELNKAKERAHILEGLLIALDHIDEVIAIIRGSESVQVAKARLMERFGLSEAQATAITEMRLRQLTGLEREKIEDEYKALQERIAYLEGILADEKKLLGVISDEIGLIAEKYGDDRRTHILPDEEDFNAEDLVANETMVVAMTHLGYIKRMSLDNFKAQHRGGKGIKGMQTIEDDYIEELLMPNNHDSVMFFTNLGRVYRLKSYEIPEASRTARGIAIVNLLEMLPGEKVTAIISKPKDDVRDYLILATKRGIVKKTRISDMMNIRRKGLIAINLNEEEGDELIEVKATDGKQEVFLITRKGKAIFFKESDVRPTGRNTMGVGGIHLAEGDEVIAMQLSSQGENLLFVTENGMGKRTAVSEFHIQKRNGQGVKCYQITEKTGNIVGVKAVRDDHEILLITDAGIIIRTPVDAISKVGRITSGVKLMNVNKESGEKVASITKVRESEAAKNLPESDDPDDEYDDMDDFEDARDIDEDEIDETEESEGGSEE